MLTGRQIVDQAIVTGIIPHENVQQHGVDLNLVKVELITGGGLIPLKGKTVLPHTKLIKPILDEDHPDGIWYLDPGAYAITFMQGCNIPADKRLKIIQRSSLFRNGGQIASSLFDAGFKTDAMGTVMLISVPVKIEVGARVAQAYTDESNVVENLYEGQFQNDAQRKQA